MTAITASSHQLEQEREGDLSLELVAVRYTGAKTLFAVTDHLGPQAQWPSRAPLNGGAKPEDNGPWKFALVPDAGLSHLEGRPDLDVLYPDQRERFAEVLLEQDSLPENVFGRGASRDMQDRVFDALGLGTRADAGPFREQLRDIAGIEEPADDDPDESTTQSLAEAYSRSELGDIAKELRADADDFNLRENPGKVDRAEFIAGFDRDDRAAAVDAALDDSEDGGEN
jgi:hypothetical protein